MHDQYETHPTRSTIASKKTLRSVFAALFLLASATYASPIIPIVVPDDGSCPDPLDVDGGRYVLTGDLACALNPQGSNLTITGSDVDVDLNGYTISPPESNGGLVLWGIKVEGERANVHDGRVSGFACEARAGTQLQQLCAGILLGFPGGTVERVVVDRNHNGILLFESFPGYFPVRNRIADNSIFDNASAGIAFASKASGSVATRNQVLFNQFGIASSVDGLQIFDNVASGNGSAGILLYGGAQQNLVRNNTTIANGEAGIAVGGETAESRATNNRIQRNTSFGNPVDLFDGVFGEPGVECLNRWTANDFGVASPNCIW